MIESFSLPKGQLPYKLQLRAVETQSVPYQALEHLEYFRTVETLSFRFNLLSLLCCFLCGGVLSFTVLYIVPCRLRAKLQPLLAKVSKENNADGKLAACNLL